MLKAAGASAAGQHMHACMRAPAIPGRQTRTARRLPRGGGCAQSCAGAGAFLAHPKKVRGFSSRAPRWLG